jgi:hypothetical protein
MTHADPRDDCLADAWCRSFCGHGPGILDSCRRIRPRRASDPPVRGASPSAVARPAAGADAGTGRLVALTPSNSDYGAATEAHVAIGTCCSATRGNSRLVATSAMPSGLLIATSICCTAPSDKSQVGFDLHCYRTRLYRSSDSRPRLNKKPYYQQLLAAGFYL